MVWVNPPNRVWL